MNLGSTVRYSYSQERNSLELETCAGDLGVLRKQPFGADNLSRCQQYVVCFQEHPGLLGSLMDYCEILSKLPEQEQCQSTWETILVIIELIAERYRKQSDFVSAIICLQAGVFSSERVLGERSPIVTRISRKAENLYSVLDEKDAEKVSGTHSASGTCI